MRVAGADRDVDAFRVADPDLAGYVLLDFDGFDALVRGGRAERRRIPATRSTASTSSTARVTCGSRSTARWSRRARRPYLLFEPPLPVRYYFALDDVRTDLLQPSDLVTYCAYKGEATYFSLGDETDLAWGYRNPLRDASEVTGASRSSTSGPTSSSTASGRNARSPPGHADATRDSVAGVSDTARNKELVLEFWAAAQPDKIPFLADDAVWHLPTSVARRGFPAQDLSGEQVHALFIGSTQVYEPDRTWDIDHVLAEDDLVTLHCTMHAHDRRQRVPRLVPHAVPGRATARSPKRGSSSTPPTCSTAWCRRTTR